MKKIVGLNTHRLNSNPEEKAFADAWAKRNTGRNNLPYLLDNRKVHTGYPPDVSDRDHVVAATLIQWLGSPVGQAFLEELGYVKK